MIGTITCRNFAIWSLLLVATPWVSAQRPPSERPLRWAEGQPGWTFSADDDGKYRYGLWTDDFGVVIAVDALELEKANRRTEPTFAVQVTIRYRGKESMDVNPDRFSLEFVDHYHTVKPALNPDDLSTALQKDADAFTAESERIIRKHPEKKSEKEVELKAFQKNIADMLGFLHDRTLKEAKLNATDPEVSGWLLFSARGKWIGQWNKQEKFVLRVPMGGLTMEFPFSLPPSKGDVLLRRRP